MTWEDGNEEDEYQYIDDDSTIKIISDFLQNVKTFNLKTIQIGLMAKISSFDFFLFFLQAKKLFDNLL